METSKTVILGAVKNIELLDWKKHITLNHYFIQIVIFFFFFHSLPLSFSFLASFSTKPTTYSSSLFSPLLSRLPSSNLTSSSYLSAIISSYLFSYVSTLALSTSSFFSSPAFSVSAFSVSAYSFSLFASPPTDFVVY